MNPQALYEQDRNNPHFSEEYREELSRMKPEEIEDAYDRDVSFGTAGIRGRMGPGRNRLNFYTIRRVSYALACYLRSIACEPRAVIAYDSRLNSREFARESARTLASHGVRVYLFQEEASTPELSFAVRALQASGGVVITASHNPKEYNGFKVYHPSGRQVLAEEAARILSFYEGAPAAEEIHVGFFEEWMSQDVIEWVPEEVIEAYDEAIQDAIRDRSVLTEAENLCVVYTPLHGTGGRGIEESFKRMGILQYHPVPEEFLPDGTFPEVAVPNPEDPRVFENARILGEKVGADLLIATDPDADRMGVMVWQDHEYTMIDGNQMGVIMLDYLLEKGGRGDVVSTIVSTRLIDRLCAEKEVTLHRTLTGFKYIGETMNQTGDFLLGFEESYGYLNATHVRDKDAINAATLVCEIALEEKKKGRNLLDRLYEVYGRLGYYLEDQIVLELEGREGSERIQTIMSYFRDHPMPQLLGRPLKEAIDYRRDETGLPKEDVIKWIYEEDVWVAIRPSGTEPKLKIYLGATGANAMEVDQNVRQMEFALNEELQMKV